jgi:hypothetical protein
VDFYLNFRVGFAKFWGGIITGGKKVWPDFLNRNQGELWLI